MGIFGLDTGVEDLAERENRLFVVVFESTILYNIRTRWYFILQFTDDVLDFT